jgi:hypothetical protein
MVIELFTLFCKRFVEGVADRLDTAGLNRIEVIDVAILERAARESDLLGAVIEQERTPYESTLVEAAKLHTTAEVKRFCVKRLVPNNPFVDGARHLCRLLLRRFCYLSKTFGRACCATQQPE